jgi:hypothetical protein
LASQTPVNRWELLGIVLLEAFGHPQANRPWQHSFPRFPSSVPPVLTNDSKAAERSEQLALSAGKTETPASDRRINWQ